MRSEPTLPELPVFEAELEARLRRATSRPRRRLPVRTAALRVLRSFNASGLHVALAVGLAATLLLVSPPSVVDDGGALTPDRAGDRAPGYLLQYGNLPDSPTRLVAMARDDGYEVQIVRSFVADRASDGEIIRITHLGEPHRELPADDGARGPLLVTIGFAVADESAIAD